MIVERDYYIIRVFPHRWALSQAMKDGANFWGLRS